MKFLIFASLFLVIACEKEVDVQPQLSYVACSGRGVSNVDHDIVPRFNEARSCYLGSGRCLLSFSYDKKSAGTVQIHVGKENRVIYPADNEMVCQDDNCGQPTTFTQGTNLGEFKVRSTKAGQYHWEIYNLKAMGKCSEDYPSCAPLPVTWTSFSGKWDGQHSVKLKWSTAMEKNNKGFHVEFVRPCQSATNFSTGDFVPSKGSNSSTPNSYEYDFPVAEGGTFYFRISQVDFDGTVDYTQVIAVKVGK